ncbi:MAG: hypothetical protein STHCBS139747_001039 [Sporothrix thermara]
MAKDEPVVFPTTPMPRGYTFVRKGNVYITAHCRRATHAEGRVVYVVVPEGAPRNDSGKRAALGIRCPKHIVTSVRAAEQATRDTRHAATDKRDAAQAEQFRAALLTRYPAVPADTVPRIVQHAMQKHAGRVARTGTLDLAARVRLAVRAHIRHCWTDYEALLRARQDSIAGGAGSADKAAKCVRKKSSNKNDRNGGRRGKENERLRAEVRAMTGKGTAKAAPAARNLRLQPVVAGSKKETAIVIDSDDGEEEYLDELYDEEDKSDYDMDSYSDSGSDDDNDEY